ncbi:MAG TPA: hypothetical protein VIZ58_04690 [Thermoanaerobaculia bacterium]
MFLALFFLAVAAAPHDHVNGLADLLLDQPSDSGEIAESDAPAADTGYGWYSEWLVNDDPCLACFNSDFVSTPAPILAFTPHLDRLPARSALRVERAPWVLLRDAPSRAPPSRLS